MNAVGRLAVLCCLLPAVTLAAQQPDAGAPQAPVAPEVIVRDGDRATIRAVRAPAALRIDGRLDEAVYEAVPSMTDFIQQEPRDGEAATERTEVWLLYDDRAVYVVARCWESQPERMVANEMRRDNGNITNNEAFAFTFDTFYDRRNAAIFHVNAVGGRMDGQAVNERQWNPDWNPIWEYAVGRFDGGWIVETAIPFKSLRYRPGRQQVWGFNARRTNRWKNELSYLVPIPRARGLSDITQVSRSATVVGLEAPPGSRNVEIKPYATSHLTTDTTARPTLSNDLRSKGGVDAKYGVTQNLTADFTYNTDFAQVEADEQQVNLTRFSLFFPEKREFFLENQGLFGFAGVSTSSGSDTPILFYSRRIGLSGAREVPILAGARLTGRVGRTNVGLLNMQSDESREAGVAATNFSAVRLRRDILRRSNVGLIYTGRSRRESDPIRNDVLGVDSTFAFFDNLAVNSYWARSMDGRPAASLTAGAGGAAATTVASRTGTSYRGQFDYSGDRYGLQLERLVVEPGFAPDAGFVRRPDMRKTVGVARFSPRPRASDTIRRLSFTGGVVHTENTAGRLESREQGSQFDLEFQNSDKVSVSVVRLYEFVPRPFPIAQNVTIPVGGYNFTNATAVYTLGQQHPVSGNVIVERGAFYDGDKTAVTFNRGRFNLHPQFSIEPTYSVNWVELRAGSFTTHLLGSRVTYTVTPMMFLSALTQYNSSVNTVAANVRLRWEYRPGSELFVVFNEQRDTRMPHFPDLANRAFIVKVNRLFRF
jgi:hypothetical protein